MKKLTTGAMLLLLLAGCGQATYKDASLPPEQRAELLLKELTLEEKVSLMMNGSQAVERLGVRPYDWWNEALHGVARAGLATVFPQPIGMAAGFSTEAVYDVFCAVSDEARAKNTQAAAQGDLKRYQGLTMWTPTVNIFRDPRWGRGIETYGEDPYLTARMGVMVVKGLQGENDGRYDKLYACAKHFAVHSGPEWNRHQFNAENIKPRDLYETYLPAFEALVKEGNVKQVMCAYNRFEGDPCCGSNRLLMQILRNDWGYDGIILSDCGAIDDFYKENRHETYPDAESASAAAVLSGTDLECGSSYKALVESVKQGKIAESDIDVSVKRLLAARFALGEMDDPEKVSWTKIPYSVVASDEHKALALDMARKSMTLLMNKDNALPLKRGGLTVAVMGPNANDSVMQWGNYNGTPSHTVTILEGISNLLGGNDRLIYEQGCSWVERTMKSDDGTEQEMNTAKSVEAVKDADVVVFVGGISPKLEGEEMKVDRPGFKRGDRTDIELPQVQRELITALHRAGKRIILVNCSGSPVGLEPETKMCEAILQAWYPGQEGGTAVAEVLFGDYNPAGRLPVTFYRNVAQLPDFENYDMTGRTYRYMTEQPLFPFGYGLSYTTFEYGNLQLQDCKPQADAPLVASIDVTNTGSRDGEEVVQLYLRKPDDTDGPQKALRAFRRITIPAGQTVNVKFELKKKELEWWDNQTNTMRVIPGEYELMAGGSSQTKAAARFQIPKE